jgi:hypothetical protein
MRVFTAVAIFVTVTAGQAYGQQAPVNLHIQDGRVTLKVQNAPVRQILAEWARIGGTRIINGDRVTGAPVTLELTNVPERQALDIVLRSVAGYMLATRATGSSGASTFDRILILPTSTPPRNPPPAAAARTLTPPAARPIVIPPGAPGMPVTPPTDDADQGAPDEIASEDGTDQPAVVGAPPRPIQLPRNVIPPRGVVSVAPRPPQAPDGLPPIVQPQPETAPEADTGAPQGGGVTPMPGNPFGVPFGSSSRPGVIAPVPQQPAPAPR